MGMPDVSSFRAGRWVGGIECAEGVALIARGLHGLAVALADFVPVAVAGLRLLQIGPISAVGVPDGRLIARRLATDLLYPLGIEAHFSRVAVRFKVSWNDLLAILGIGIFERGQAG